MSVPACIWFLFSEDEDGFVCPQQWSMEPFTDEEVNAFVLFCYESGNLNALTPVKYVPAQKGE